MKKILFIFGIFALLLVLKVGTVLAEEYQYPGYIRPFSYQDGDTINVPANTEIELTAFNWVDCNKGMINLFTESFIQNWSLDGVALFASDKETASYWSEPTPGLFPWVTDYCVNKTDTDWSTQWRYTMEALPTGVYTLHWQTTLAHPIADMTDGLYLNGEPIPYHWTDGLNFKRTIILNVE